MLKGKKIKSREYKAGYDCAKNGANTINCHFSFFSTPEQKKEWEKGYNNVGRNH